MFNLNVSLLKKKKTLYVSVEQFEVLSENVVFFPHLLDWLISRERLITMALVYFDKSIRTYFGIGKKPLFCRFDYFC